MRTVTHAEASAMDRVSKLCRFFDEGTITKTDVITSMLHDLSCCPTPFAAEQCAARLPQELHAELEQQVSHWLATSHPGELFVFAPIVPTDDELIELDNNVQTIGKAILKYLANPTGQQEYQTDPLELTRNQWATVQRFETIDEQYCKRDNCNNWRVKHGVLCREHHYEMLYGNYPSNTT